MKNDHLFMELFHFISYKALCVNLSMYVLIPYCNNTISLKNTAVSS